MDRMITSFPAHRTRRLRWSTPRSGAIAATGAPSASAPSSGRAEDGEVVLAEFVGGVDPAELERHAVAKVAGLDVDGIGDEEGAFGQLERDDRVGRRIFRE